MLFNGTKVVYRSKDMNVFLKNKDGRNTGTLLPPSAFAKTANTDNRNLRSDYIRPLTLEVKQPELEDNHSLTCLLLLLKNTGP